MYQRPPVSKSILFHLSVFYSLFVYSVEYYKLEFLDTIHSLPLETTEYNKEQHMKDYSGLFAHVVLLLSVIPHPYYLLYDRLLPQK